MLEVHINKPDEPAEVHRILDTTFIIGRGKSARLKISSEYISRLHLKVECVDGSIYIQDLTLNNWVSYSGEKLSKSDMVPYIEGTNCTLPGDISLEFFHVEETGMDRVKHEVTQISFNVKKYLSKSVQEEREELNRRKEAQDNFFDEQENKDKKTQRRREIVKQEKEKSKQFWTLVCLGVFILSVVLFFYFDGRKDREVQARFNSLKKAKPRKIVTKYVKPQKVSKKREFKDSREKFLFNLKYELKCRGKILSPFCLHFLAQKSRFEGAFIAEEELIVMIDIPYQRRFYNYDPKYKKVMKLNYASFSSLLAYNKMMHANARKSIQSLLDEKHNISKINLSFYEFDIEKADYFQVHEVVMDVDKFMKNNESDYKRTIKEALETVDMLKVSRRLKRLE